MVYEIVSDGAAAQIDTKGAELRSLKDIFGTEYIYCGDTHFWNRRSPILFPIIGEQKDGEYEYGGNKYKIGRHGFARDMEFRVTAQKRSSLLLLLTPEDETFKHYPFNFRLEVCFKLENASLHVAYSVTNTGREDMYFCIGGHTGYNCPLVQGEEFSDYLVEFEKEETFSRLLLNADGLYNGRKKPFLQGKKSFGLTHSLFDEDAIVPDNLSSKTVTLKSQKSGKGVKVDFDDFQNLAVWSAKGDAPFVCLEPWNGRASSLCDGPDFKDKHGVLKLEAGKSKAFFHRISLL